MEIQVKGTTFHYQTFGQGVPILMLHGWPVDHRYMVYYFEPLFSEQDQWLRIYPDLPGMGKSPAADWIKNQDDMLDALLAFIDKVIPNQPFAVAGTSYGGLLVQGLVYRRPQSLLGAAFIAPHVNVPADEKHRPEHVILQPNETLLTGLNEQQANFIKNASTIHNEEVVSWFKEQIFPGFELANHAYLNKIWSEFKFSFDEHVLGEPFAKPVLFLSGKQDTLTGYAQAWKYHENFPRASYVVLDRAGHALGVEQKSLFEAHILDWIARVRDSVG